MTVMVNTSQLKIRLVGGWKFESVYTCDLCQITKLTGWGKQLPVMQKMLIPVADPGGVQQVQMHPPSKNPKK